MSGHTWRELERADMDTAAAHRFDEERRTAMTDNRTALLPCPFCGGEAELHPTYDMDTNEVDGWFAWCDNGTCECKPETGQFFTEAEAIAAWNSRAEHGTLTAEQVREAIFNGSSYASYDGAKYYADGISMQAIADELNACAERTCQNVDKYASAGFFICGNCGFGDNAIELTPNYCPECGAKVVGE